MRLRPVKISVARGFTLLELITALLIMSIISAAIFSTLHTAFKLKARAEIAVEPLQRANIVLDFIQRDLESALPPTGTEANLLSNLFYATDAQDDRGNPADDVIFAAATDAPPQVTLQTDIRKIEYTLIADGQDYELVRYVTSNLLAPVTATPDQEILCRGVRSFNLEYFDGTNWNEAWDSTTAEGNIPVNSLPVVVLVTLVLDPLDPTGQPLEVQRWIRLPCSTLQNSALSGLGDLP